MGVVAADRAGAACGYWGRAVGTILYVVLAAYVVLVGYELFLLRNIPLD